MSTPTSQLYRLFIAISRTFLNTGDIILYDSHLIVYKHSLDLIIYLIGGPSENELMMHAALVAFSDAVHMLLRNQVEKRAVMENLDLVLLCLDETIDDGYVQTFLAMFTCELYSTDDRLRNVLYLLSRVRVLG